MRTHLASFKGHVQTDAHAGYEKLPRVNGEIRLLGCWVHERRPFKDALADPMKEPGELP